jgi:hypothetical protein
MRALNFDPYGRARPAGMAVRTAVPCILLTRKGSQVQTLSRPPQFSLVRALSVLGGQRSSCAAAALRPHSSPPTRRDPAPLGSAAPPPPRRPRSVVTTFWFGPVVGPPPGNLPRTHLREDLSVLAFCRASKPTGRAPSRWTALLVDQAASVAPQPRAGEAAARPAVDARGAVYGHLLFGLA